MKKETKRTFLRVILFLVALYAFFGFALLPIHVQSLLTKEMKQALQREVTVDHVVTNPFALSMAVEGLRIMEEDGSTVLLSFKRVYGNIQSMSLIRRALVIREIAVVEPFARVERFSDGTVNLQALLPPSPEKEAGTAKEEEGLKPLPVEVDRFALLGGKVQFTDRVPAGSFETTLHPIDVNVRHFRTVPGSKAEFALAVTTEIAETVTGEGTFSMSPLASDGTVTLADLFPGKYFPYVRDILAFSWETGKVNMSTGFQYRGEETPPGAILSGLAVTLTDLRLLEPGAGRPFVEIPLFAVRAVDADLAKRQITIGEVASSGGALLLKRLKDGSLNVGRLVAMPEPKASESTGTENALPPTENAEKAVPRVLLAALNLEGYRVVFEDASLEAPATIELLDLRLAAENLSTGSGDKGTVSLAFRDPDKGTFLTDGTLGVDPLDFQARILVEDMALYPFQPYVLENLNLLVTGGSVSLDGTVGVKKESSSPPAVAFAGSIKAKDYSSAEATKGEELLRFQTALVEGLELSLEPNILKIQEVMGSDFYARIVIRPDKSSNLLDVVKEKGDESGPEKTEGKPAKEKTPEAAAGPVKKPFFETVAIDKVTLDKGRIDFTDLHVSPAFTANLYDMEGTVEGLFSDEKSRADVRLKGTYEKVIPLVIEGQVNPLGEDLFVDLKVIFQNVDLSPLTPYGRKYLGYPIDKGKLFLNLKYHIENNKLDAKNAVLIDQFTLGDPVESPDAVGLPIKLAIALLKDRQGKIDLDIPLSGQTDDPEFSIGGIILKVLGNLIVKAVTAPFALLGAVFGGGEELGYVEFLPGETDLDEEARKKLETLARALYDRPLLKLEITGHVNPEQDGRALREARLEDRIKAEKVKDLAEKGRKPPADGILRVEPEEYERFLKTVYRETVPAEKRKGVDEKALSEAERKKMVLDHLEITDGDLRKLAYDRAANVRDFLLSGGQVEKERLFLMEPRELVPQEKSGVRESRVEFSLKN